jgi:hypothetical protein
VSPAPTKNGALHGLGEPRGTLVVIDPGKRTGVCVYTPDTGYSVNTAHLDELPRLLGHLLPGPVLLACEDYSLRGGVRNNDPSMPSAQGIGMCRTACDWTDTAMFLISPGNKRAGHMALDAQGLSAWQACRNDHERDTVDLTGYVLREMRRPA